MPDIKRLTGDEIGAAIAPFEKQHMETMARAMNQSLRYYLGVAYDAGYRRAQNETGVPAREDAVEAIMTKLVLQ